MTFEELCDAIDAQGYASDRKMGYCPAHDDKTRSLSVAQGDKGLLIYCHAGCATEDVVQALGVDTKDLFKISKGGFAGEQYVYTDALSNPVIRVTRTVPKGFTQEHWEDGKWVPGARGIERPLYNLPEIDNSTSDVYWTEGEKDADLLTSLGYLATTIGGATAPWHESYEDALAGRRVHIIADNDGPGRASAAAIFSRLEKAESRDILIAKEGKDFHDHYAAGWDVSDLQALGDQPVTDSVEWMDMETEDEDEIEWLLEPILPREAYCVLYGAAGAGKSYVALALAGRLSHAGFRTTVYSEENPTRVERRRMRKLGVRTDYVRVASQQAVDLADPEAVQGIINRDLGQDLIILDSYSVAFQSRESDENLRAVLFSRVVHKIVRETGATFLLIDHSGFDDSRLRGASAKGQQADVVIHMKERHPWMGGPYEFRLTNEKASRFENPFTLDAELVDTQDGGIELRWMGKNPIGWENLGGDTTNDTMSTVAVSSGVDEPVSSIQPAPPMTYKTEREARKNLREAGLL